MFGLTSSGLVRTLHYILFLDFGGVLWKKTANTKPPTEKEEQLRVVFSCSWRFVLFGLTSSLTLQACEACDTVTFLSVV